MRAFSNVAAVIFLCCLNPALRAQSVALTSWDSTEILRAGLIHAQEDMQMKGELLIAPDYPSHTGIRDSAATVALGQAIGARFTAGRQVISCDSARCQMSDGVTLVNVSPVRVINDTVLVHVAVTRASHVPREPLVYRESIYELANVNGRWTVVRLRAVLVT